MSKSEERIQILKMVQNGTITADEAAKLLDAIDEAPVRESTEGKGQARRFRVRVTDTASGRSKANINIPIGLVNIGMRMGAKFAPNMSDIDMEQVLQAVKDGTLGKIIDVEDTEDGEHVEIYVE
ncbi:MAG: FKBP-type peptidyl-prolyl cis-trans isomerase N-terminal domain-containing protein [Chloroflexi bacterium]|nr:FKBP-type peptidyl-prolyl cis-trans isomerase N-terminal domain-containing protein [Chloroflexota bacterium]